MVRKEGPVFATFCHIEVKTMQELEKRLSWYSACPESMGTPVPPSNPTLKMVVHSCNARVGEAGSGGPLRFDGQSP